MNVFAKLRFPKTSLALFIIGALVLLALPVRIMLEASINLPPKGADFQEIIFSVYLVPIILIALPFLLLNLVLWLPMRKKGIKFMDVGYPVGTLSAIAIFVYFHLMLVVWFSSNSLYNLR